MIYEEKVLTSFTSQEETETPEGTEEKEEGGEKEESGEESTE